MEKMKNKIYWLDNLRTFMVFLVVLTHVALTYERYSMGSTWWIVVDPSNNDLAGIIFLLMNIFVMATIFFISGYFAPFSLKTKTNNEFLLSKFKRLIIPWLIAVLSLIPAYKVIFLYVRNMPQEHWTNYFHWNVMWSQNWLWFLPVLFLFNFIYLFFSKIDTTKIKLNKYIFLAITIGLFYCFFMDYFDLHGWIKTILLDFQNERILVYFLVFLVGTQTYKLKTFESIVRNKKRETIIHSLGWIPINIYIAGVIYALIYPNDYLLSKSIDILIVRLSFLLSVTYMIYAMVYSFKNYINVNNKIWDFFNKNSYEVYIIHVIVMGVFAAFLFKTSMPSTVKLFILLVTTYGMSNLIVYMYKRLKNNIFRNRT